MCVASAQVVCTERKEPLCILWLSAMRLQISSAVFAQRSNPCSRQTSRMCRWSYLMLFILPSFQTAHLASPEVWPKKELFAKPSMNWLVDPISPCLSHCGMMWNVFRCCQILRRPFLGWYSWCWHFTASVQPQNLNISTELLHVAAILAYLDFSWPRFYLCEYLATSQAGGAQWTVQP